MAIKVHGPLGSPAVMRVVATLLEKGLEFELVPVSIQAREHKKEPYLSLNPFGQVPAFEDGDLKLFESRAITQYIAHTYADKGTQLLATEPKKLAIMTVWMEVEAQKFDPTASKLYFELGYKPIIGLATDDAAVKEHEEKLNKILDVYESRLKESKYLGGDTFTLADLHHLPVLSNVMTTRIKSLFDSRPHVSAWCADIFARPAWTKALELKKQ